MAHRQKIKHKPYHHSKCFSLLNSKVIKEYHPSEEMVSKHSNKKQKNSLFVLLFT